MRFIISFFLTLIVYSIIIFFFYIFLSKKQKEEKKVYIHTAIIAKKTKINSNTNKSKTKNNKNKTVVSNIKKTNNKVTKSGSIDNFTHGGEEIKFNDIFKNVNYDIDTKKIKIKKQLDMSRLKGIERNLEKIKKINFQVNLIETSGEKLSKEEINDIISQKLSLIWDNISTLPSEYAKIQVVSIKRKVIAKIIDSNLAIDKQNMLILQIENLKFDKNFKIIVLFQSKVNND